MHDIYGCTTLITFNEESLGDQYDPVTSLWCIRRNPVNGLFYASDFINKCIRVYDLQSNVVETIRDPLISSIRGLHFDHSGLLYFTEFDTHYVKMMDWDRCIVIIAGDGRRGYSDGACLKARFCSPCGILVHGEKIYVADTHNHVIRVIENGFVSTFAGDGYQGYHNGAAMTSRFNFPMGMCIDREGSLIVCDSGNGSIRKIQYVTENENELPPDDEIDNFNVSTIAGTGKTGNSLNSFNLPSDVTIMNGDIYFTDTLNECVRRIVGIDSFRIGEMRGFEDGDQNTCAFRNPMGLCSYRDTLYVNDTGNQAIRKIEIQQ